MFGRLSWQQPLQSKFGERFVYDEASLKAAIGDYIAANVATPSNTDGRRIVFACSFTVKNTIYINGYCPNLIIDGNGHTLTSTADPVFNISTSGVKLVDLKCVHGSTVFAQFTANCSLNVIERCEVSGRLVNCIATATGVRIINNIAGAPGTASILLLKGCIYWFIVNNRFTAAGISVQIVGTFGDSSDHCLIMGNIGLAGGANSNLSTGNHTWIGNINFGVIANAGSDTLSANT